MLTDLSFSFCFILSYKGAWTWLENLKYNTVQFILLYLQRLPLILLIYIRVFLIVFFSLPFLLKMFLNRGNLLQSGYYFFCLYYGICNKKNWVIPAGTITVSVLNHCNLWWIYPSWYLFNTPVQAIIVLSKSRLKD